MKSVYVVKSGHLESAYKSWPHMLNRTYHYIVLLDFTKVIGQILINKIILFIWFVMFRNIFYSIKATAFPVVVYGPFLGACQLRGQNDSIQA